MIPRFMHGDVLDVAAAAGGYSRGGFAGTYLGPERAIGLLQGAAGHVGPRADLDPLRAGLEAAIELAHRDSISRAELAGATHLCPCQAAASPDGAWMRSVLFEQVTPGSEDDLNRQITALMLLESLSGSTHGDPELAFRLAHGFGAPIEGVSAEATARRAWRAAVLRNYSVSAWRHLWAWLSEQLVADELSVDDLADRLADAVGSESVAEFVGDVPPRTDGVDLLALEEQLRGTDETVPRRSLRLLVVGAMRIDDLDVDTRDAFLGLPSERLQDLGPQWLRHQLDQNADRALAAMARDLVATMLARSRRVAASKMRLNASLQPYVPTRLHERDGLYSMRTAESDAEVSLRSWTLAQVLAALGAIDRPDGKYALSPLGESMRAELGAAVAGA